MCKVLSSPHLLYLVPHFCKALLLCWRNQTSSLLSNYYLLITCGNWKNELLSIVGKVDPTLFWCRNDNTPDAQENMPNALYTGPYIFTPQSYYHPFSEGEETKPWRCQVNCPGSYQQEAGAQRNFDQSHFLLYQAIILSHQQIHIEYCQHLAQLGTVGASDADPIQSLSPRTL